MEIKIEEEKNEQYPITVSDWLEVLRHKSGEGLSVLLVIFSITVTSNAVSLTILKDIILLVMSIIIAYFGFFICYGLMQQITKPYEKLYEKILQGKITDPKEILKEYNKIKRVIRKKYKNYE